MRHSCLRPHLRKIPFLTSRMNLSSPIPSSLHSGAGMITLATTLLEFLPIHTSSVGPTETGKHTSANTVIASPRSSGPAKGSFSMIQALMISTHRFCSPDQNQLRSAVSLPAGWVSSSRTRALFIPECLGNRKIFLRKRTPPGAQIFLSSMNPESGRVAVPILATPGDERMTCR